MPELVVVMNKVLVCVSETPPLSSGTNHLVCAEL